MVLLVDEKEIIEITIAKNMFSRMKGLMGKNTVEKGLLLSPCNSIHTFFMKVPIDVLYLDKCGHIVSMNNPIIPWKVGKMIRHSKAVIELPSGTIKKSNIKLNQKVTFLN